MPSPGPGEPSEASGSSSSSINGAKIDSRSIHAFWSNGKASIPPPAAPVPTKRKRRKPEDTSSQARLLGLNGASWSIGKVEDGVSLSGISETGSTKGKGRRKEGEEEERKEMVKRARRVATTARRSRKNDEAMNSEENAQVGEPRASGDAHVAPGAANAPMIDATPLTRLIDPLLNGTSNPSPGKRKRGRPRKSGQPIPTPPSSPSPNQALPPANGHSSSSPTDVVVVTGHRLKPDRSAHPIFQTVPSSTKGASHDPISVDEATRSGPRKLVFASDHKPAQSFFSAPPDVLPQPVTSVKDRIEKVHSFIQPNGNSTEIEGRLRDGWGKGIKEGEEWAAPWPKGDWPSHAAVAGPSSLAHSSSRKRKRKTDVDPHGENVEPEYWRNILRAEPSLRAPTAKLDLRRNYAPRCEHHPALLSLARKHGVSNRDTWCERYRPHRAEEVLGDEVEATYLRDWLSALQIGSCRRVSRKVKRPKRQLFDGWIVDDIGLFGDADEEEDDEELPEEIEELEVPLGQRPSTYAPLNTRLTNTILLTGPHGSGKSAAVYAAATELGWEVFEVYPGTGKRTGANLMSLVGDVGKNHMVVEGELKDKTRKEKKGAIKSFFSKSKEESGTKELGSGSQGSADDPIEIQHGEPNVHGEKHVRQSLILIDEVDILFGEEYTFWPAVISLIAESRRPVILTCNGECA